MSRLTYHWICSCSFQCVAEVIFTAWFSILFWEQSAESHVIFCLLKITCTNISINALIFTTSSPWQNRPLVNKKLLLHYPTAVNPTQSEKENFSFVCFPLVYSKWVLTDFWSWEHIFWKAFLTLVCWINPAAIFHWSFLINTTLKFGSKPECEGCFLSSSASCVQRLFLRGD